ncbi:MAG TPA: hypothetical protein VK533_11815 [Sphingomonas sp.]|uniref:glycosyltransferase family 9 protein n=1 Tax=Sphingomonas sp. TaxID=28214 RepID=UPI002BD9B7A3|nr:hypothetical protein [Sphingomonas sp.]HMI20224.1 hypothetical protein [Sphingomonas sp.]
MTGSPEARSDGVLESFLAAHPRLDLAGEITAADGSQAVVHAPECLQDERDYRGALQRWFGLLTVGGVLVLTVPHAFLDARQDRLPPPRRPRQQRLYTPASLLSEVEEALAPNSYRLRWLADRDGGYDYALDRATPPTGQHDIALVIERIAPPAWDLAPPKPAAAPPPDYAFEPLRTRAETMAAGSVQRILLLKLDHLGDFVMAAPAMRAVRAHFPDAHITLVVAEWNAGLARRIGIADELLIFEAFPRNTGEVGVDIGARLAQFDALIIQHYDLAIDLRTFGDTRLLLRNVDADHKAGIGHRGAYPFLDIFLPLDPASDAVDHAWSMDIGVGEFFVLGTGERSPFQIGCDGFAAENGPQVLTWGPYRNLMPGDYLFQPFLDADFTQAGLLAYDIAIDTRRIAYGVFDGRSDVHVPFTVADKAAQFEFRLWTVGGEPVVDFRFYGGRLIKQGAAATLHQSEYLSLLVELVAMRLNGTAPRAARSDAR